MSTDLTSSPVVDSWAPAGAGATRTVKVPNGSYALAAGRVVNLTASAVYVNLGGNRPPPTASAHDLTVAAMGMVSFPLNDTGVQLALAGDPGAGSAAAPALVETVLADDPSILPTASGTTIGTITGPVSLAAGQSVDIGNIAGAVAISGGVINVQTSAGVSVSTKATFRVIGTAAVPASGAALAGPFTIPADTASLLFEWPGVLPLNLKVIGNQTGVRYAVATIDATGYLEVPVDAARDSTFNVSVEQVTAGSAGTLTISASTGQAGLSAPVIYPYSQLAALTYGVKNLPVIDVSGKRFFATALVNAGPATLIPATPNTSWSGYSLLCVPDTAVANCVIQIGTFVASAAFGPINFDFRGAILAGAGAALTVTQIGGPAIWRVSLTAAPITT